MANIITAPESGIYFDGNTAGTGVIPVLTGNASGVAIQYDGYAGITISSSATGANYQDRFSIEGENGRLFGVSDQVTGSVFSVNDGAGLPLIDVDVESSFSKITLGQYGTDAIVISGSSVQVTGSNVVTEGHLSDENYVTSDEILTHLLTVDGANSNLDADKLDGQQGSYYLDYGNFSSTPTVDDVSETNLLNRLAALDSSDTIYIGDAGDDTTVVVRGTLQVDGSTTTINSNTLSIGDNQIVLNNDVTGTPTQNAGIIVERGTSTNASLIWDEANDYWKAGLAGSEVQLALTNGTYSGLRAQATTKTDVGLSNVANESKATMFTTPTFTGGGNTATLKKGTGNPALAFAGTSDQASALIEGIAGGGLQIYTSNGGTLSSPSWSTKMTIAAGGNTTFTGTVSAPDLTLTSLSAQNSELTALMINGSNVVGTRELGSAAFSATSAFATAAQGTSAENALPLAGGTMTGHILLNNGIELRSKDTSSNVKTIARINSSNQLEYGWSGGGPVKFMGGGSYTERMRIHSDGNIGIGTTSPAAKLDVYSAASFRADVATGNPLISIVNNTATSNTAGTATIKFTQANTQAGGKIVSARDGNYSSGATRTSNLQFYTSTAASDTEKMRITSAGNVGIGTTSPAVNFQVGDGTTDTSSRFYHNDNTYTQINGYGLYMSRGSSYIRPTADNSKILYIGTEAYQWSSVSQDASVHLFSTNGSESMRIDSAGNVGIGTTNPSDFTGLTFSDPILDVAGAIQSRTGHIALGGISYRKAALFTSTGNDAPYLDFRVATSGTSSSTTARMRIDANGNVGIGDTTPSYKLDVNGTFRVVDDATFNSDVILQNYQSGTVSTAMKAFKKGFTVTMPESNDMQGNPYFMSDLAYFNKKGGTVTATGLTGSYTWDTLFRADAEFVSITSSEYSGSTFTLELSDVDHVNPLTYGAYCGITFGSSAWEPSSVVVEFSTDDGSTYTTALNSSASNYFYYTKLSNTGTTIKNIKFTIGLPSGSSIRIANIFATDYNGQGMKNYFVPSDGGTYFGDVTWLDSQKAKFGSGSDLQIYHDGSNSYIDDTGTGDLYIRANNLRLSNADGSGQTINTNNGGNVELFFNNSKKFETASNGVSVTGNVLASNNVYAAGSNGFVFGSSTSEGEYIYRSGNDIRVLAGGADRLTVDGDAGNVGIGTTNPDEKLEVAGKTHLGGRGQDGGAYIGYASLSETQGGAATILGNAVYAGNANNVYRKTSGDVGNFIKMVYSKGITFHTNVTGNAGSTEYSVDNNEQMRIDLNGNVGIGTTSPTAPLTFGKSVYGGTSSENFFRIKFKDNGGIQNDVGIGQSDVNSLEFNKCPAGIFSFNDGTNGEVMRIHSNGNVGIGTTSPDQKLQVIGDVSVGKYDGTDFDRRIGINSSNGGYANGSSYIRFQELSASGTTNTTKGCNIRFYNHLYAGNTNETLVIQANGNVGIGVTSPDSKLHVASGNVLISNNQFYTAESTLGTNYKLAGLTSGNVIQIGAIDYTSASTVFAGGDNLSLTTGGASGTTRLYINSSGEVGIGTTSPATKLDVAGTITASGGGAAPSAPASASATIVGETVEVTFTASTTSNIDAYLVYSSIDGSDYGLISVVPPDDFAASMSIIDNAFDETGTQAYRVYATKLGKLSSATTASVSYAVSSAEPTTMSVINLNNAYYVQWNPPSSNARFVTAYNVYKHEHATQGSLSRSSASLVYSGMNTNYMYQISGTNNNNFHQFWVETTIA